jgi:hypothetical protein
MVMNRRHQVRVGYVIALDGVDTRKVDERSRDMK